MYMTLSNKNESIGGGPGQAAFDAIVAAHKRGVRVRIAKVCVCVACMINQREHPHLLLP